MTKSDMYRLARNFGTESRRSFAVLKKIGDVAAVLFLSAYAAETKAILFRRTGDGMPVAAAAR
jgi:hypothetical protein